MSWLALFLLALAVSLDATAVAIARACHGKVTMRGSLVMAGAFGAAQAIMPAIGAIAGARLAKIVQAWDHWIAFGVLGFLGAKMMRDALTTPSDDDVENETTEGLTLGTLFVLSIATSIDALAVGVTLPMTTGLARVPVAVALIGLVTFTLSFVGSRLGRVLGEKVGTRLGGVGGLLLVALGTKILIEHLRDGI